MLDATLPIVTDLVRGAAHPLTGAKTDYDRLLDFFGEAHFALLGEAPHGTHKFTGRGLRIRKG